MNNPAPQEAVETPEVAAASAEERLHQGEPLLAYNAAQAGLLHWPDHVRLRQLQGLALARSGDVERANELLARLADEGHGDAETLGMLARTHKDLALAAKDDAGRRHHLQAGFRLYARAFENARRGGSDAEAYYAGINAATMAVLKGELDRARGIARDVREICARPGPADEDASSRYWKEATLGEAALILGEAESAAKHYVRAAQLAGTRFGDLSSTRRQIRLLAAHLPGAGAACAESLRIPPVVVFTGNMIDRPDRRTPRFPAAIEAAVRAALARATRDAPTRGRVRISSLRHGHPLPGGGARTRLRDARRAAVSSRPNSAARASISRAGPGANASSRPWPPPTA